MKEKISDRIYRFLAYIFVIGLAIYFFGVKGFLVVFLSHLFGNIMKEKIKKYSVIIVIIKTKKLGIKPFFIIS